MATGKVQRFVWLWLYIWMRLLMGKTERWRTHFSICAGRQSCDGNQLVIAYIETNFSFDNKHLTKTFGQLPHNLIPISKCHSEWTRAYVFPFILSRTCSSVHCTLWSISIRDPCSFLFICFYNLVSIYPGIRQDWIQLNRTVYIHTNRSNALHSHYISIRRCRNGINMKINLMAIQNG